MRGYTNTPDQVHAIEDAFADGMTLRAVVKKFGIGCQTARNIRDGEHQLQIEDPMYHRCPGCGGKVLMPCILCRERKLIEQERTARLVRQDRLQDDHLRHDRHQRDHRHPDHRNRDRRQQVNTSRWK